MPANRSGAIKIWNTCARGYEEKSHHFYLDLTRNAVECMIIDFFDFHAEIYATAH